MRSLNSKAMSREGKAMVRKASLALRLLQPWRHLLKEMPRQREKETAKKETNSQAFRVRPNQKQLQTSQL